MLSWRKTDMLDGLRARWCEPGIGMSAEHNQHTATRHASPSAPLTRRIAGVTEPIARVVGDAGELGSTLIRWRWFDALGVEVPVVRYHRRLIVDPCD